MNGRLRLGLCGITLLLVSGAAAGEQGPRLKFRDKGPACMCVGGLSEEDIRRSQRRENVAEEPPQDSPLVEDEGENVGIDSERRGDE